jgi:glucosylceramidase
MLVQSTTDPNTFWKLPDYYLIAQFSKFVQPGARRVFSANGTAATLTNVSFLNPDGTLVTIIVNQTATDQPFSLQVGGKQIAGTIPTKTVGTYLWKGAAVGHIAGSDGCVGARLDLFFSLRAAFHACDGDADQQFTVGVDGTLRTLGLCLTAADSSVRLSWCTGSTAQQWKVSGGAISALGKCLDTGGVKPGRFASVRLAACTGGAEQTWRLPA